MTQGETQGGGWATYRVTARPDLVNYCLQTGHSAALEWSLYCLAVARLMGIRVVRDGDGRLAGWKSYRMEFTVPVVVDTGLELLTPTTQVVSSTSSRGESTARTRRLACMRARAAKSQVSATRSWSLRAHFGPPMPGGPANAEWHNSRLWFLQVLRGGMLRRVKYVSSMN